MIGFICCPLIIAAACIGSTAAIVALMYGISLIPDPASAWLIVAGAAGLAPVPGAAAEQEALIGLYGRRARWWSGAPSPAVAIPCTSATC